MFAKIVPGTPVPSGEELLAHLLPASVIASATDNERTEL
jgi:hypothetical protein